jgi:hypothetical protein
MSPELLGKLIDLSEALQKVEVEGGERRVAREKAHGMMAVLGWMDRALSRERKRIRKEACQLLAIKESELVRMSLLLNLLSATDTKRL